MANPIFKITDGTTEVSLLTKTGSGINTMEYTPKRPTFKDGGVFADSSLTNGRQLQMRKWTNIIDVVTITVSGNDTDKIIEDARNLTELLEKATAYWTTEWQNEPVWIERRGSKETNSSYSLIHSYQWENDDNPFAPPFFVPSGKQAMNGIDLAIEHGFWLANPPGESECVELSNLMTPGLSTSDDSEPTAQNDDAYIYESTGTNNYWSFNVWSPDLGLFVAVGNYSMGGQNGAMSSEDGTDWITREASSVAWTSVCWSPDLNLFVAVGFGTSWVMTSPDGINWTLRFTGAYRDLRSVYWSPDESLFVAVGYQDMVITSPDGINWTERTGIGGLPLWNSVVWSTGESLFVAVGTESGSGRVMTSPDGINWTDRSPAISANWYSVCWSSDLNLFVAIGYPSQVMTSPDGINWTDRSTMTGHSWYEVIWSSGLSLFVAVGSNNAVTSPDGINWTNRAVPGGVISWNGVAWSPSEAILSAVGNGGNAMTSPDGINWTLLDEDNFRNIVLDETIVDVGRTSALISKSGIRFRNVAVPAGAIITGAYINITVVDQEYPSGYILVYGETDTTPDIYSTYADFVGRALTTQVGSWQVQNWGVGSRVTSPNLAVLIQEIIDGGGWVSGNDLAIQIRPDVVSGDTRTSFASFDSALYDPPELIVQYLISSEVGREATCKSEVYVANKDNLTGIDTIFRYDDSAGTYSANLFDNGIPFDLFPSPLAVDDCLYIGLAGGVFSSAVFDIGTAADSGAVFEWEYWDGAWKTLTVVPDKTSYDQFKVTGVGAIVWEQPSVFAWTITTINGVVAYWIRARVTTAAGNTPTQKNRDIYTVISSSADIDEDEVAGDITAISKINIVTLDTTRGKAEKIIIGLRSLSRGEDFIQHINADEQNNDDITTTGDVDTTAFSHIDAPTGSTMLTQFTNPDTMERRFYIEIDPPLSNVYYGRYRAFARAKQYTSETINDGDIKSYLNIAMGASTKTNTVDIINTGDSWYYFDYGIITIPPAILPSVYEGTVRIDVYADNNAGATISLMWVDLVLVPVDEYALEIRQNADAINNTGDIITADSLSYIGKSNVFSVLRYESDYEIYDIPLVIASGPVQLQANVDQRLYWFVPDASKYEWLGRIQVWKNERYLTFRGDE